MKTSQHLSVLAACVMSAALCGLPMCQTANGAQKTPSGKLRVYVGTYTSGPSKGIYVCDLDLATGKLSKPELAGEVENPSFLEIHPSRRFVYAVGEMGSQGNKGGVITAFAVNPTDGKLKRINQQPTQGEGPCYVSIDKTGKNALVSNYSSGGVASLPIAEDGSLQPAVSVIQHSGSSVDPARQQGPHAHSINIDAGNRFAIAADLGLDKLLVYRLDPAKHTLVPNDPPSVSVKPGSGPRHFAFHPNGKFAYANNEMASTVTAFTYDAARGTFKELQTLSTLPQGYNGKGNSTAETRVHPNGKFVYVSNRGHNSIAIFSVDAATGKLTLVGNESTRGKTPRNFNLDPTGAYLIAANQDSHNVVAYKVDSTSGKLTPTGSEVEIPSPVCVRFMALD